MFSCLQILEAFLWFVLITLLNVTLIILTLSVSRLLNLDRKSGSAGMPRPISYAVFCLKKKNLHHRRLPDPPPSPQRQPCRCTPDRSLHPTDARHSHAH